MSHARLLKIGFILLILCISLSGIFSRTLWKPDEPRVAEIGREMWLNHQYVIPTLNRAPFLEKPPLYWWVMSASYGAFGVSDGSARLPSALFGFLTLLFTYLLGKQVGGERTGVFAALILASTLEFSIITHRCLVDNALTFFVTLGYYGFFKGHTSEKRLGKWIGYELMAVAAGLAFLSKGVVGPGLIVVPPFVLLLLFGEFRELKGIIPQVCVGILIFIGIVTPWVTALYLKGGESAFREYLLQNTLGRMLPTAIHHYTGGHRHPFSYYFTRFPQDFIPWIIALPATLALFLSTRDAGTFKKQGLIRLFLLFILGFLILSLPATKRRLYLVPLYPLIAIPIGGWFASTYASPRRASLLDRGTLTVLLAILVLVPLLVALGCMAITFTGLGPKGYDMTRITQNLIPLLPLIVPMGIAGFLFLGIKFLKTLKVRSIPSSTVIFATTVILIFAYHEGAVRIMDPVKSMRQFPDKIAPYLKGNPPLAGFRASELTRGIIPFYTGRYVQPLHKVSELSAFFKTHPGALLIIPEKQMARLPADVRSQFILLAKHDYSHRFKLRLYQLAPSGKPRETRETRSNIPPGQTTPVIGKPLNRLSKIEIIDIKRHYAAS